MDPTSIRPAADERRLDGIPILETAIAPIHIGPTAPAGAHSMELTDAQQEILDLKELVFQPAGVLTSWTDFVPLASKRCPDSSPDLRYVQKRCAMLAGT